MYKSTLHDYTHTGEALKDRSISGSFEDTPFKCEDTPFKWRKAYVNRVSVPHQWQWRVHGTVCVEWRSKNFVISPPRASLNVNKRPSTAAGKQQQRLIGQRSRTDWNYDKMAFNLPSASTWYNIASSLVCWYGCCRYCGATPSQGGAIMIIFNSYKLPKSSAFTARIRTRSMALWPIFSNNFSSSPNLLYAHVSGSSTSEASNFNKSLTFSISVRCLLFKLLPGDDQTMCEDNPDGPCLLSGWSSCQIGGSDSFHRPMKGSSMRGKGGSSRKREWGWGRVVGRSSTVLVTHRQCRSPTISSPSSLFPLMAGRADEDAKKDRKRRKRRRRRRRRRWLLLVVV